MVKARFLRRYRLSRFEPAVGVNQPVSSATPAAYSRFLGARQRCSSSLPRSGTIAGWNESLGATATTILTNAGEAYTGLALVSNDTTNLLYAANSKGTIDVFDSNFAPVVTTGGFSDPALPTGLTPYNIAALDGNLYVAYSMGMQAVGQVDEFDTEGNLIMSFKDASLNAPWGLTFAPSNFGTYSNDLLVGNKGDGTISVFNPANAEFLGQLEQRNGKPIVIPELWALVDGTGAVNATPEAVYFTAGPDGYAEGLFGTIETGKPVKTKKSKGGTTLPGPYTGMPGMPTAQDADDAADDVRTRWPRLTAG